MSSIITAVPSGPIQDWCIQAPFFDDSPQQCANVTRGSVESDFETICCDGAIVDTTKDLFRSGGLIDLANLVCCRIQGPQEGGLLPLPSGPATECSVGTPIPLASLAATNTRNAQGYLVTYTSASYGSSTTGDFVPTETPYCLWANTASGVAMTNITVPVAQITTLSSTSYLLDTIGSSNTMESLSRDMSSDQTGSTTRSSSSSAAGQSSVGSTSASLGPRVTLTSFLRTTLLFGGAVMLAQYL